MRPLFRIGCAGWAIPKLHAGQFPAGGSHLARYGRRFNAVEINSSFYRPHRRDSYARWAASVPHDFRFAVKAPQTITHERRAADIGALEAFLAQASGLAEKLGPLLLQFPPKLSFDEQTAQTLCAALRARFDGLVVVEPPHASWFAPRADALLREFHIGRAAADPAVAPAAAVPGGWNGVGYFRLHGSPHIYYSEYDAGAIERIAQRMMAAAQNGTEVWCIFNNTAAGAATVNALSLQERIEVLAKSGG